MLCQTDPWPHRFLSCFLLEKFSSFIFKSTILFQLIFVWRVWGFSFHKSLQCAGVDWKRLCLEVEEPVSGWQREQVQWPRWRRQVHRAPSSRLTLCNVTYLCACVCTYVHIGVHEYVYIYTCIYCSHIFKLIKIIKNPLHPNCWDCFKSLRGNILVFRNI